jgi:hypothetical protein
MALVERLMHWGNQSGDSEPPDFEPIGRFMPVHQFFAAVFEVAEGPRTAAQIKTFYEMTPADETDFDALIALSPAGDAARALYVESIHAVFLLAGQRVPNYSTPAELRARLGI